MTPLDLLVRGSIVLAAAWMLAALLRSKPAALCHWVLSAGLAGAALAPALTTLAPAWHLPPRAAFGTATVPPPAATVRAASAAPAPAAATAMADVTIAPAPPSARRSSLAAAAGWIWLAGAVAGLLTLGIGLGRLAWIAARAEPLVDARWDAALADIARAYGISRTIALLQTDRPLLVTWGVARPKVVVPDGAASWPLDRIRIVLAHELAHVARRDWATQLAAEVVRAAHWCNPLAWIVCRRARLESEHACDDAVLNLGISGSDYASQLLELARSMHARRAAWVPAQAIVRPSSLERRVAAMLNARVNHSPSSHAGRVAATAAVVLITTLAAGFSAAQGTTALSGTVTDQLGGAIANTTIALRDLTTNASAEVHTNATGQYAFAPLPSGDYMMTIKTIGFQPVEQRIVLTGATLERNVTLRLGMIQESLTVTDAPPSSAPKPAPNRDGLQRKIAAMREQSCDVAGGCIAPPIKLNDKKPIFPDSYTGPGEVVVLKAIIDAIGHVTNLQVVGNPNPDLAQAAMTAVNQWEFEPTRLDGQVVDTNITITVNFKSTK